ncbi:MAG: DUF916 domain-containing protein [Candidatus Dormibacter sp.]
MTPRTLVAATLAAAGIAALAAWTMPARAGAASPGGGVLTVSPAHPDASVPGGNAYFVHSVTPGTRWTDEVAVVNTNDSAIDAWVDPVDGITSIRTGAVYSARTVAATRAGAWVTPQVGSVTVDPHVQIIVAFTVTVPVGATAGDHLAGIAFESKQATSSGAITTVLRSVVAVQVRVRGPAVFQLRVFSATLGPLSTTGTSGISVDMEDIGGFLGKPLLQISVEGPAGYHRAESLALDTMLPGDRITDEILWPDELGAGAYRLSISEDGSGRHGAAFIATVYLTAAVHPASPLAPAATRPLPTAASDGFPAWILFGGVAGGACTTVLAILLVASARRRRPVHAGLLP